MGRARTWRKCDLEYPKRDDPDREPKLDRLSRHIKRERMLTFRSVPVKRRIWWVTLTRTSASFEDFKPQELAASLTFEPQAFWCLSRRKARALVGLDREQGGSGTLYPVEYRLCAVCSRVLLGPEAAAYRKKMMKPMATWQFEQGPMCGASCKPHRREAEGRMVRYQRRPATPVIGAQALQ